uniref:PWI domain-containing protein n=1 Tax=Strongyloides stercoralis TaxID=6248 RepID=A0A0K0ERJ9_STRER
MIQGKWMEKEKVLFKGKLFKMNGTSFRREGGTDTKFTDKEKKMLNKIKFEKVLDTKIENLSKIDFDLLRPWISKKIIEMIGVEDDIVENLIVTSLQSGTDPKLLQMNLAGFFNARNARIFMGEFWNLLIEASNSKDGIPQALIDLKLSEVKEKENKKENRRSEENDDWNKRYESMSGFKRSREKKSSRRRRSRSYDRRDDKRHRDSSRSPDRREYRRKDHRRRRDSCSPRRRSSSYKRSVSPKRKSRKHSDSPRRKHTRKYSTSPKRKRSHSHRRSRSIEKKSSKKHTTTSRRRSSSLSISPVNDKKVSPQRNSSTSRRSTSRSVSSSPRRRDSLSPEYKRSRRSPYSSRHRSRRYRKRSYSSSSSVNSKGEWRRR